MFDPGSSRARAFNLLQWSICLRGKSASYPITGPRNSLHAYVGAGGGGGGVAGRQRQGKRYRPSNYTILERGFNSSAPPPHLKQPRTPSMLREVYSPTCMHEGYDRALGLPTLLACCCLVNNNNKKKQQASVRPSVSTIARRIITFRGKAYYTEQLLSFTRAITSCTTHVGGANDQGKRVKRGGTDTINTSSQPLRYWAT